MKVIKVIIVDDHELVRSGLKNFFSIYDELELIADVSGGKELLELPDLKDAHVILMDIKMPEMDGAELCSLVKKDFPSIKVLSLTSFTDTESVSSVFKAGSDGLIFKDISPNELLTSIKRVYRGYQIIDENTKKLIESSNYNKDAQLTSRELEILKLLVQGLSNKKISQNLFISTSTVKYHISNIFMKLGVTTRTEAVSYALKSKIL